MIEAYRLGKDIYATIAAKVYRMPYEKCLEFNPDGTTNPEGKTRRTNCKSIVLGIMYGRMAKSIAEQTGMTTAEAQSIIDGFFEAFPKVKAFVDGMIEFCKTYGYVETIWGRKRRLPEVQLPEYEFKDKFGDAVPANIVNNYMRQLGNASNKQRKSIIDEAKRIGVIIRDNTWTIAEAERKVVNSIIQGSSADITKKAMILIGNNERLKELGYKMIIQVHDEIIGIVPKTNAKECLELVHNCMLNAPKDKITLPFKADLEVTYKWYGEEVDLDVA